MFNSKNALKLICTPNIYRACVRACVRACHGIRKRNLDARVERLRLRIIYR